MESLFSIGQKVVCVDSRYQSKLAPNGRPFESIPLIEGKTYTVKGMHLCSCGRVGIDVGVIGDVANVWCGCGAVFKSDIWYFKQTRFVPLDDDKAIDEQIRESLNQKLLIRNDN